MILQDNWALAMLIYGWFLAACYPDGTSHEDDLPFERLLTPKSYLAMLNTRKNARSGGGYHVAVRNPIRHSMQYIDLFMQDSLHAHAIRLMFASALRNPPCP